MWLENQALFGLIGPFARTEIRPLTVIIGLNGAGKSQLLRAIKEGHILTPFTRLDLDPTARAQSNDVVLLTNTDTDPTGLTDAVHSELASILHVPVRAFEAGAVVRRAITQQRIEERLLDGFLEQNVGKTIAELGYDGWAAAGRALAFNQSNGGADLNQIPGLLDAIQQADVRISSVVNPHGTSPRFAMPGDFIGMSREQFCAVVGWTETNLFSPDVVSIFLRYRDRRWRNQVQRQTDEDDGTCIALSKQEFEEVYGPPPWELLTAALHGFGLPYDVQRIPSDPAQPVNLILVRKDTSSPITFTQLSSGERVLLRMMLAIFQANDERLNVRPPKLVLLDELDAFLHPENVHRWLTAIQDGYVGMLGISCILTTHSPTTVALAPDDSIFEIRAEAPWPIPISKQYAIDRLTTGLPMLAIDYSARRQVFTESTIDVDHYAMLHDLLRQRLPMQRTLSFVGTSTKGSCVFVYDMVKHMEQNGNRAVFGIVDWDLKNMPTRRVKVLANGSHYSKDNVLLDPLLVGALLLKGDDLTLDPPVRYSDLRAASSNLLQRVSDAVVSEVSFPPTASHEIVRNHYCSGLQLDVRKAYQLRQGHDLEKAVKTAFPMLEGRYRAEGQLASEIIRRVLGDYPEFCPKPICDLMLALSNDAP
jgi:hypothetical protein